MGSINPKGYVGMVMQKVNASLKAGEITGAQSIAFHKRLVPFAQHAQDGGVGETVDLADFIKGLQSIERDLARWQRQVLAC